MKIKRKQVIKNKNSQSSKIKDLISFNNIKNPFKDQKESEQFFKSIIEEEMNLSNNYNSENLNRLLDLYFKGINYYQNTPNTDKVNAFIEKSQVLLQSSKAKKLLNQNKTKNLEINENKTDSTLIDENEESDYSNKNKMINKKKDIKQGRVTDEDDDGNDSGDENKLNYDFKKYKTIRHNEIQNRNRLNYLSNSIKKVNREKDKQKLEIKRINTEFINIREKQLKTSIFLEDEIKKQSDNFKVKLLRKRTMVNKLKNPKLKIDTIQEENMQNEEEDIIKTKKKNINKKINIGRNNTPNNNKSYKILINIIKPLYKIKILRKNSFSLSTKNNNIFKQFNKCINENTHNIDKNNKDKEKDKAIKNENDKLKEKVYTYLEEYNNDIYKYYFLLSMNNILDLGIKNFSKNKNIYEGYQTNIKDLLKQQMSINDVQEEKNLEDEINSLKVEQDHEIDKNNDFYEKIIDDEISKFKRLAYSNASLKELDILKNKIKCDLYNKIYNTLNK